MEHPIMNFDVVPDYSFLVIILIALASGIVAFFIGWMLMKYRHNLLRRNDPGKDSDEIQKSDHPGTHRDELKEVDKIIEEPPKEDDKKDEK